MIHRAIAAALLVGLGLPALAGSFDPVYNQAADMTAGSNQSAIYDGATSRAAVPIDRALAAGGAAPAAPIATTLSRPILTSMPVPAPTLEAPRPGFFGARLVSKAGAAAAPAAKNLAAPLGAAIGAMAGLSIGLALSKLLS